MISKYSNLLNIKKVNPLCKYKFSKRKKIINFLKLILELITKTFKSLHGDFLKGKRIAKAMCKICKKRGQMLGNNRANIINDIIQYVTEGGT